MLASIERNIKYIKQGKLLFKELILFDSKFKFHIFFTGQLLSKNDNMLTNEDFHQAAKRLVPSVSVKDLLSYQELERKIKNSS